MTQADRIVSALLAAGVRRLFGVPGGGSSADIIEAACRAGLPFTLAHTETAAAFMATAQSEITGRPGACVTTLGPGAASVVNGVANAWLERAPLIVLTDCAGTAPHQALPQNEMFRPITKWSGRLDTDNVAAAMGYAIETSLSGTPGPVHLDLATEAGSIVPSQAPGVAAIDDVALPPARRPVFLCGLGARKPAIAAAVRQACERYGIPALVTYKAKGVMPDQHPWFGGVLTNGSLERPILERADLLLSVGLDTVELIPRPWTPTQPVESFDHLAKSDWDRDEVASLAETQRKQMRIAGEPGELLPNRVVELTAEVYAGRRITVDAGAHMFPVMSLWPATDPCGVLISNGLSTMGFALPAAIGAALLDRSQTVVVFTGDGGLLMCLAELRTAARERLRLRIIVFEDGELTLIKMKQEQRKYQTEGVTIGDLNWREVACGMGVTARTADSESEFTAALRDTAEYEGPVLIAARITPRVYPAMMRALRGDA